MTEGDARAAEAAADPRATRIREHVAWLIDRAQAGRGTGTDAERAVTEDLARRLADAGVEPAGAAGYLQRVPLVALATADARIELEGPGGETWSPPPDAFALRCSGAAGPCRADQAVALADLAPATPPLGTTSGALRLERQVRESEIALVRVDAEAFAEAAAGLREPTLSLVGGPEGARPNTVATKGAHAIAVAFDAWQAPAWLADAPAGARVGLRVEARVEASELTGWNVAGIVRGTDPARAGEAVVLTAHHDHLGRREIAGEAVVYPGAVDNALSVAELVEVARALAADPPARSVVLLAPTGEEHGFLGTRHWLATLPPDAPRPVVNWNHDGASEAWGRATTAVLVAREGSPLAATFAAVAGSRGIAAVPNPFPSEGFFFRSDHYVFAEAGIAAALVFLGPGYAGRSPEWGAARAAAYLREAYHQPGDDLSQIETWDGAVQFVDFWIALARASASR